MEIVQTMNSDPGLAVGKYRVPSYRLIPICFNNRIFPIFFNVFLFVYFFYIWRLHSVQWGWLRGNIPREHCDRWWLCWLHLRLPGLLLLLRGDVETNRANILAGCTFQSRCWARNTAQGKWLHLYSAFIQTIYNFPLIHPCTHSFTHWWQQATMQGAQLTVRGVWSSMIARFHHLLSVISLSCAIWLFITRLWNLRPVLVSIWGTPSGTQETPPSRSVSCGKTPGTLAGRTKSPTAGSSSTDHRLDTSGTSRCIPTLRDIHTHSVYVWTN